VSNISDPHKVIVPTYKSFRNLDDNDRHYNLNGNLYNLLVAETSDLYLKLAHNNNNYNDDEQPLFLTICVTAIDKLGRSVGAKTNLFKSLESELKEIIDREIYEICNSFQQQMIANNQMMNLIEAEDQSIMLFNATQNVFKIFMRVLSNHKTVFNAFKQSETFFLRSFNGSDIKKEKENKADRIHKLQTYSIESVWNGMQRAILQYLLKKYLESNKEEKQTKPRHQNNESAVESLLNPLHEQKSMDLKQNRSRSPSPSPSPNPTKQSMGGFGKRLKNSKFFKRGKKDNNEMNEEHINEDGGDLFSGQIAQKYHEEAMDGLTFSFADSNVGSIVLEESGMTISKHHIKDKRSEFAAHSASEKKRLSLSKMTAFNVNQKRDRSGTGLDAFSVKHRQKRQQQKNE